jgi:hypothetical protein
VVEEGVEDMVGVLVVMMDRPPHAPAEWLRQERAAPLLGMDEAKRGERRA